MKVAHDKLIEQKKEYINKILGELEQERRSVQHRVSQEEMISEDLHSRCHALYMENQQLFQRIEFLESLNDNVNKEKLGLLEEIDRMMMRGEDVLASYHREWRKSDERRYLLEKTENKLDSERRIRERLMGEYEGLLTRID